MWLTYFSTVRARLLALVVVIALPIACLTAIAAITTYRTVVAAIQTSQARAVDDFAVRTRVWYRGVLRSLLTGSTMLSTSGRCDQAGLLLASVQGYRAVLVARPGAPSCTSSLDAQVDEAGLSAAMADMKARQPVVAWGGSEQADVRYGEVTVASRRYLAVYAKATGPDTPASEGLLLVDPELLGQVFNLGDSDSGLEVALVGPGGGFMAARGDAGADPSWLPRSDASPQEDERWLAQSRAGPQRAYATRMVAEPDIYVIASFNEAAERAARTQFLALLLAPLMTLALLCVVYLRAIDSHCIRWLRGIEAAARTKAIEGAARAPIAAEMPSDMRSVAEAFNLMLDEQEVRQRKLQTALDNNRFLVRELHHRVKNSLQVVQSYIGLTKREYGGDARLALADAECRVHVLSAAYRFTLADGEMQPVRVDPFLDDVVTMISNLIRRRDQWIVSQIKTNAALSVDRIIPLGFLIVDVVARALRYSPGITVTIAVSDIDKTTVQIEITADREIDHTDPPKLFAGLMAQIEAVQTGQPAGSHLGSWRLFHHS